MEEATTSEITGTLDGLQNKQTILINNVLTNMRKVPDVLNVCQKMMVFADILSVVQQFVRSLWEDWGIVLVEIATRRTKSLTN